MSSLLITCPFCMTKNRLPLDRIGQRAKCGACGQYITEARKVPSECRLCNRKISAGVHLSDGGIVHQSCMESIQEICEQTESEVSTQHEQAKRLRSELERRERIVFKISSVFSTPSVGNDAIRQSIAKCERKVLQLKGKLESQQAVAAAVYDYLLSYPPDWSIRRRKVIERDGEHCSKCRTGGRLHLHHVSPLSRGGDNKISNLKLLCENCHSKEHGGRAFSDEFRESETAFSKRIANIRYAILHGKRIRFGYKKPGDKGHRRRTVIPAELISKQHRSGEGSTLCVRGYCELRQGRRVFALKRMRGLKVI